ncbi:MAG: zinc ABC transporter substrate-binding protein [Roseovarius sp.]
MAVSAVFASASAVAAEVPRVVTDIAPVHALVARVMEGVGEPEQIVRSGASPHGYALRPSEADALANADAVFWIGPELTPWLERTIETVAPDAEVTALLHAPGSMVMDFREGPRFDHGGEGHDGHSDEAHVAEADDDEHDHGHDEHDHDDGHDDHEHGHKEDHGHEHDRDDDHAHDHGAEEASGHGHGHEGHDHSGEDPHAWLDPDNAKAWLRVMAETLGRLDPANAETYAANAEDGRAEIDAMEEEVTATLAPLKGARFVVFHDAYHYFEHHFGLPAAGAIAEGDAADPGPARIEEVRELIRDLNVTCVLSEPTFNPDFVRTVIEGRDARSGVIDPLGGDIEPGPDFYPALMRDVTARLATCAG